MKNNRQSMIWGTLLVLFGVLMLLETMNLIHIVGQVVWAIIVGGIGLPFLFVYLNDRQQWWALIPGVVLVGVGVGILVGGQLSGIIITFSVGLPFLLIYLNDRNNWWALIPAWVMTSVSLIIILDWVGLDNLIAPWVMFAIALPFLAVYATNRDQWWALIPAGITGIIGIGLLVGAVLTSGAFWGIAIIAAGLWLILRNFRSNQSVAAPASALQDEPDTPSPFAAIDEPDPAARPQEPR